MRPFGSKSEQGKTLQLVQRGTDKRIPVELVKQPSGEVLDPTELEELSVKVASESGAGCATIPHTVEDKKLVVEVTAEVTRQLGLGVYTLTATGRIPDPAYADGYHDYEIVVDLCKVTKYGSNETPVKVQAKVLEGLKGKDGKSAYEIFVENGYQGSLQKWMEDIMPKGGAGGGGNGKSAYELAVQEGYQGTLQEWLKSLVGKDGADAYEVAKKAGYTGSREEWLKTLIGATGLSAYELAKAGGYEGSLTEWLASLKGEKGDSAYEVAVSDGYVGDKQAWLASLRGSDGKDAYELAKAGGYQGSREAWLASLKGDAGKSAYELAKAGGYQGSQADWLASLEGKDGKSAYELAKEAQSFTGSLTEYLASLKGAKGDKGDDAYQVYLQETDDNPKLSRKEWADTIGSFANLIKAVVYGTEEQ